MRNYLFAFASLASLVSITAVASAEPYDAVTGKTVAPEAEHYVEAGGMAGANAKMFTLAATLDGGAKVGDGSLWVHGRLALGGGNRIFDETLKSDFEQLRVGFDSRHCALGGELCGLVGMDLGVEHGAWTGYRTDWGSETTDKMTTTFSTLQPIAVPRVGLDIGGKHLRWRSGLEMAVAPTGVDGVDLTTSLAYRF